MSSFILHERAKMWKLRYSEKMRELNVQQILFPKYMILYTMKTKRKNNENVWLKYHGTWITLYGCETFIKIRREWENCLETFVYYFDRIFIYCYSFIMLLLPCLQNILSWKVCWSWCKFWISLDIKRNHKIQITIIYMHRYNCRK